MSVSAAALGEGAASGREQGPASAGPVSFRWAREGLIAGLNHVLDQQPWSRDRLRMHAGRVVELNVILPAPIQAVLPSLRLAVSEDARFEAAHPPGPAAVRMTVRLSIDAGFAWLREGPVGLQRHLSIEGDVLLAAAMAELAQRLRWDWEEDLSRVVGDLAAHRAGQTVRAVHAQLRDFGQRVFGLCAARVEEGEAGVVGRGEWAIHQVELDELDARIAALEMRTARNRSS